MILEQKQLRPSAARRAQEMIGQEEARDYLQAALRPGDRSVQVVFVRAEGGMGKTRLLEEILREHGPQPDPEGADVGTDRSPERPEFIITQLIDVIDTRLHDRFRFISELRHSLLPYRGALDFSRFEAADNRVRVLTARGALFNSINDAQNGAVDAFIADLARIAARRRVVILIDTVERLSYHLNEWLLEAGLLRDMDLEFRTHHWLRRFIADPRLENVTLVLAGRGREGREFFDRMAAAVEDAAAVGRDCRLNDLRLRRFSLNQTRQYFAQLAEDWRSENPTLAGYFTMAADPTRDIYKVIGLYTHGVPVRLALYAQLIVEGRTIPADFKRTFAQACQWAEIDPATVDFDAELTDADNAPPALRRIQWKIEEGFLDLLFRDPRDQRNAILRALVCAPRGLTAEQLHFALDASADWDVDTWQAAARRGEGDHPEKLAELLARLQYMAHEYLAKRRPSVGFEPFADSNEPRPDTFRVGLQDEIYRIYAEHMGLLAAPISAETEAIRDWLTDEDRQRYRQNWADEMQARQTLYEKLAAYADYQVRRHLQAKRELLRQDEIRFEEHFRLDASNTYSFLDLPAAQVNARHRQYTAQTFHEIERMAYRLLLDPVHNLNTDYITLEDDNNRAARQEEDFWAQAEMWRVVHDDWLMKFMNLDESDAAQQRGETKVAVLRRFAEQENVARWIKRFVLRGSPNDIAFGEAVEKYIFNWPRGNPDDPQDPFSSRWNSWNHTMSRAERVIWTQVGYIRRGVDVAEAADRIKIEISKLERLYSANVRTKIETDGRAEWGFAAVVESGSGEVMAPAHRAFPRLRRLLAHAYNHLGYSQRTLGHMRQAAESYSRALNYLRPEVEPSQARAMVLNNLSRVLSDLGFNSVGIGLDGLALRWELAEEVPLASSYNTLALIYDDMGRYEDAPLLSAKAIAYCRRAQESRQLGLSLRQMATALRHLADRANTGQRTAVTPEAYFDVSETLLREAQTIFGHLGQTERQVEVYLELGSLERDRLERLSRADQAEAYNLALSYLETAERLADEKALTQHVLDAQINRARVYYYVGQSEAAARTLQAIMDDARYQSHLITPGYLPNMSRVTPQSEELRDRNWVFRHLATAHRISGWLALDQFHEHEESTAQVALSEAAEAYALAIAYAELYSPRSRSISTIQNDLYRRLRQFNHSELAAFAGYLDDVGRKYPGLPSVPLLSEFLTMFLGLEPPNRDGVVGSPESGIM